MRVLQLTAHYYPNLGGVETHLHDLVHGLLKRDISVFVLTYRPLTTKAKWNLSEKLHNKKASATILRLPWFSGLFYKFVSLPILEFLYLLPGLFIATPFVILLFRPNVIHAHGLVAGFVGVFWGKIFRKRVIISTHSIYHFPESGLYSLFVKGIFKYTDHILTLSMQSKEEIKNLGIKSSNISVFTYWVDLDLFKPQRKSSTHNKLQVLFVGRLIEEKGVLLLLNKGKSFTPSYIISIVGDGPLKERIYKASLKDPALQYLGRKEQNELPDLYNDADVLIVPSIHEEGFGRIILESLSCGTPVIASKRGGIVEAMDNNVGWLIETNRANIRALLNTLSLHPEQVTAKRKKARQYAKKRFSEENISAIIKSYEY